MLRRLFAQLCTRVISLELSAEGADDILKDAQCAYDAWVIAKPVASAVGFGTLSPITDHRNTAVAFDAAVEVAIADAGRLLRCAALLRKDVKASDLPAEVMPNFVTLSR